MNVLKINVAQPILILFGWVAIEGRGSRVPSDPRKSICQDGIELLGRQTYSSTTSIAVAIAAKIKSSSAINKRPVIRVSLFLRFFD